MKIKAILAAAVIAQAVYASAAHAATIDTYTFSEVGWDYYNFVSDPVPGAYLSGAFTGVVEPSGRIKLSDLTSFIAYYGDTALLPVAIPLSTLVSFSFDTTGGPSSLNIFAGAGQNINVLCVGADASTTTGCEFRQVFLNPAGTNGAFFLDDVNGPFYTTSGLPTLTLVSSIATTPLPATLPLLATGLGSLGLLGWRRKRKVQALLGAS